VSTYPWYYFRGALPPYLDIKNVVDTSADVYFGREKEVLKESEKIKKSVLPQRGRKDLQLVSI
jgi:hypothetical protein